MLRRQAADRLPHRTLLALLGVLAAVLVPHLLRAPLWLTGVVLALLAWRGWVSRRGLRLPPNLLTIFGSILAALGVAGHFGTIVGLDAGVSLLVLLSCLKLLETRSRRDTVITVFLGYFLMLTHFLFDQSLLTAAYMLVCGWATTSVLVAISHRDHARLRWAEWRQAASLLLQGLPVMALLFFLFPRLPGPLWGMPEDSRSGTTGLSETIEPGSISELSRSDALAFRVRFEDEPPPPRQRYWRAIVMAKYDGQSWSRAEVDADPPRVIERGEPVHYTITIEPHNARWLFGLDLPTRSPGRGELSFFHERLSDEPVTEAERYEGVSYTDYRLQPELSSSKREAVTRLPDGYHPQARSLAARWRERAETDAEVVARAKAYFRNKPFEYTLTPPPLPDDRVDGFLFETRSGFCEYYASAFTVLMRAADIPARVVGGYQGAEESATGEYWNVRQSDAHAWSEVWLPEQGWQRVDPTAVVSPERIGQGLGASVPETDRDAVPTMASGARDSWLREVRRAWDVVDATWTLWVISYGPSSQNNLLEALGLDNTLRLIGALGGGVAAFMTALGLWVVWQQTPTRERDPVRRLWRRAQRRLARRGLPARVGEGPRDYAERVARDAPELAPAVREVAHAYLRLRYYPGANNGELARLRRAVKRLRRASR